ncbi:NucA/NucB deoxyribonuclease domain-containing protein [Paractinoplanes atraurantiacus]|uniref:NucA/NucB deoxyribonuclease domain-containing protein n=1 Tax=Paractinoplanes atraurantiacus TaxID=1036182 RepID=UPI0011788019|nr:hypothetical protein [Actinoplanes atraurantiacus]
MTASAAPAGTVTVDTAYISGPQWFDSRGHFTGRVPADGDLSKMGFTPNQAGSPRVTTRAEAAELARKSGSTYGRPSGVFATAPAPGRVLSDDPISPAECREHADLATQPQGWIKNHFSYCHIGTFLAIERRCIGVVCVPLGIFQTRVTLLGEAYNGSRAADFRVVLDEITVSDSAWRGRFAYRIDCAGAPSSSSCTPRTESMERSPIEWIADPEVDLNFWSDADEPRPEHGEQLAFGVFLGTGAFTFRGRPTTESSKPETSVRFDSAWYLTTGEGSIFDRTVPWMSYSKSDTEVDETAAHIEQAQLDPASTKPTVPDKHIPGASAQDPLTRLYHDTVRRDANRDRFAIPVCRAEWPGYPDRNQDCDEYPFSSTYQGAARHEYENVPYGMFSARALDADDNEEAGTRLGIFMGYDRIIDGDDFYVRIVS